MSQERRKDGDISRSSMPKSPGFKFNVHAPEFVPRLTTQVPDSGYFYPYLPFLGNGGYGLGPDWFYFGDPDPVMFIPDSRPKVTANSRSNDDVSQKIVKQVEYQFSDTNLVASDFLMKIMNKDPDGYVPMSVIASWKKIKSLGANHQALVKALKTSTKLVVSDDGKKVRRKQLFTERDREELQSHIVVVENLPEDYSRQNLEKIFSVVGSVKNIRICHPQEQNTSKSTKGDMVISNKLHAFVEYETADQADKAVEKLNDERNWRKGLRVRSMLRRSPRSVIRNKRSEFDHFDTISEDDQSPQSQTSGSSTHVEHTFESSAGAPNPQKLVPCQSEEIPTPTSTKKIRAKSRTKTHGLVHSHSGRGLLAQSQQQLGAGNPAENSPKSTSQGPRMPDGTRGFTMGRGKPLTMLTTVCFNPIQL
ncbi:uncharacterized protein A4U43_C03F15190 [Asparagus officinalis]|uniref:HTH La-type RNA-binding domain-containing protein n=1 Tax=Asparagus officinalis TaxID=4686 RepID=A0A5P1FD23_ASPOF|nr:la-related protein 6C [Asparagus officinalis]ONK75277.1 uncharacterized protein A4U43_C03F15190 [Asparagus officinalis]